MRKPWCLLGVAASTACATPPAPDPIAIPTTTAPATALASASASATATATATASPPASASAIASATPDASAPDPCSGPDLDLDDLANRGACFFRGTTAPAVRDLRVVASAASPTVARGAAIDLTVRLVNEGTTPLELLVRRDGMNRVVLGAPSPPFDDVLRWRVIDSANRVIDPPPNKPKPSNVACLGTLGMLFRVVLPPNGVARMTSKWSAFKRAWPDREPSPCESFEPVPAGPLAPGVYKLTPDVPLWKAGTSKEPVVVPATVTVR